MRILQFHNLFSPMFTVPIPVWYHGVHMCDSSLYTSIHTSFSSW